MLRSDGPMVDNAGEHGGSSIKRLSETTIKAHNDHAVLSESTFQNSSFPLQLAGISWHPARNHLLHPASPASFSKLEIPANCSGNDARGGRGARWGVVAVARLRFTFISFASTPITPHRLQVTLRRILI